MSQSPPRAPSEPTPPRTRSQVPAQTQVQAQTEPPQTAAPLILDEAWIYKVTVLADRVARRIAETVQGVSALNLSQWRVLAAVADTPGRTASQLVAVTPMDKGIVSRAVAALVADGLLARQASTSDARSAHLHLTPAGAAVYDAIIAALRARGATGDGALSAADERAFLALINKAIERY